MLTIVVLRTPGPPIVTDTFEDSATRTALAWPGAGPSPVFRSTQGTALSGGELARLWAGGRKIVVCAG